MKKIFLPCLLGVLLLLQGCTLFHGKNHNSKQEAVSRAKVELVQSQIGANLQARMDQLASLHYGVDYALQLDPEPSKAVQVAKDLNTRALSLSGAPTLEEAKAMRQTIDDLTSQLQTERDKGKRELELKDTAISVLQAKEKALDAARNAEIEKYMKIAQDTAAKADSIQTELNKMNSFMGLGAVFYGVKHFVIRAVWILLIGSILYLILRFASMSNPIAASIFSIFDTVMSWFVQAISLLAPKAVQVAGHTATAVTNAYRNTMVKFIDEIQMLKEQQKADPNKKYTLDELLTELSKTLDSSEKAMIDKIKKDIGYN